MSARWWIAMVCLCLVAATATAKEKPRKGNPEDQKTLDYVAPLADDKSMHVDGNLNDWEGVTPVEFSTLLAGEYEYDWTGPKDLSASMMAQYSATKVYFVISVNDNAVVAKRKQWKSDRVELWITPESGDGKSLGATRGISLDIGPQVDGGKATAKFLSGKQGGLEAVGFIGPEGYDFEVSVDYSALSKKSPVMNGAWRVCVLVRDWDQDDPNEDEAAVGSCPISPKKPASIARNKMGKIAFHLQDEIWAQILRTDREVAKSDSTWSRLETELTGTGMPEMVFYSNDKLVVAGLDNGRLAWTTLDLPQGLSPSVLTTKDVNGDKLPELIVTRREHCTNGPMNASRTYVFSFANSRLKLLTSYVEEQKYDADSPEFVRNTIKLTKNGITQTLVAVSSADMQMCSLSQSEELIPVLLPSDGEKTRTVPFL